MPPKKPGGKAPKVPKAKVATGKSKEEVFTMAEAWTKLKEMASQRRESQQQGSQQQLGTTSNRPISVHNSLSTSNTQMQSQAFPTSNNNNNAANQPQSIFLNPTNDGAANNTALNTQQSDAASSVLILTQRPQPNGNNNSAAAAASTSNLQQHAANNVDNDDDHRGCRMLVDDDDEDDAPQTSRTDNKSSASILADGNNDEIVPAASKQQRPRTVETQPLHSTRGPARTYSSVAATASSVPQQNAQQTQRLCSNGDDETCDDEDAAQTVNQQQQQAPQQQQQQESAGFSQANELAVRHDPVLAQMEEKRQERRSTAEKADAHKALVIAAAESLKRGQAPPAQVQAALQPERKPSAKAAAAAAAAAAARAVDQAPIRNDDDPFAAPAAGSNARVGLVEQRKNMDEILKKGGPAPSYGPVTTTTTTASKPASKPTTATAKQQEDGAVPAAAAASAPKRRGRNQATNNNDNNGEQLVNVPIPANSANRSGTAASGFGLPNRCSGNPSDDPIAAAYRMNSVSSQVALLNVLLDNDPGDQRIPANETGFFRQPRFVIERVILADANTTTLQRQQKLLVVGALCDKLSSIYNNNTQPKTRLDVLRHITAALTTAILSALVDMVLALQLVDVITPEWLSLSSGDEAALPLVIDAVIEHSDYSRQHRGARRPDEDEFATLLPDLPVPPVLFYFLSVVARIQNGNNNEQLRLELQDDDEVQQPQRQSAAARAKTIGATHVKLTPVECYLPLMSPEQQQQHAAIINMFSSLIQRLRTPYKKDDEVVPLFTTACVNFSNKVDIPSRSAAIGLLQILEWCRAHKQHVQCIDVLKIVITRFQPTQNSRNASETQFEELLRRRLPRLFEISVEEMSIHVREAILYAASRSRTTHGICAALQVFQQLKIEECKDEDGLNVVHRSIRYGSVEALQSILAAFCKQQQQQQQQRGDDDEDDALALPEAREARGAQQQQQQQQQTRCWWDTRCHVQNKHGDQLVCTPLHLVALSDKFEGESGATAIGALKSAGAIYETADPTPYSMTIDEKVQKAFYDNYADEVEKEDAPRRAKEAEEIARKDAKNNARKEQQHKNKRAANGDEDDDAGDGSGAADADAAAKPAAAKPASKKTRGKKAAAAADDADAVAGEVAAGAGTKPPPKRGKKSNNGKNNNNDGLAGEK